MKLCSLSGGVTAALLVMLTACQEKAAPPPPKEKKPELPVIGVIAPLTGPNAAYGIAMKNGIELAAENQPVRVIFKDDQSRPEEAAAAAQKLIVDEKAVLLIGEASSSASLVIAPLAQRSEVVMITPSSTDPNLTEIGDFIFRVCFADPFQAEVMAEHAKNGLGAQRSAILRDIDSSYSVALAEAYAKTTVAFGGKIVLDEAYGREDESYDALAHKVKASRAQVVYVPGFAKQIPRIAAALKKAKVEARLLGGDGFDSGAMLDAHAGVLEGAQYTAHFSPDDPRPEVKAFVAAYNDRFNEAPDSLSALGYDAAKLGIEALLKSNEGTLRDRLKAAGPFTGVTGAITFDEKRNAKKAALILGIERGRRVMVSVTKGP
jgi:branched-chain amino acid transport system substrate-binding protein